MTKITAYTKLDAEDLALCVQWLKKHGVTIVSRSAAIAYAVNLAAESIARTGETIVGSPMSILETVGFQPDVSELPVPKAEAPILDAGSESEKLKQMLGEK